MSSIIFRATAPLRLGLAGGGTDVSPYCDQHHGAVVNATISMFVTASIIPRSDDKLVLHSINQKIKEEYDVHDQNLSLNGNDGLVKATYLHLKRRFGFKPKAMEITIHSDAPVGSGLGSSSTCTVALVSVLSEFYGLPLSTLDIARVAYEIERKDLQISGGKQDQYAATYGGLNFMEFHEHDHVVVNPINVKKKVFQELQHNMVLYFGGGSRRSDEIINEQIQNVKASKQSSVEAMHRLKQQAIEMKDCLVQGEIKEVGHILNRGWEAKKEMAQGISNPQIQNTIDLALSAGATGGKVSGAGGGGFMFLFCPGNTRYNVIEELTQLGGFVRPFTFVQSGVKTWKQKY